MSAVEEYRAAREGDLHTVTALTITMKADAAIAELEEQIIALQDQLEGQRIVADGTMKRLVAEGQRRINELNLENQGRLIVQRGLTKQAEAARDLAQQFAGEQAYKREQAEASLEEAYSQIMSIKAKWGEAKSENAQLRLHWQREAKNANRLDVELEAAEALSQAHCKDCANWTEFLGLLVGRCEAVGRFSSRNYLETPDTFVCRWWAARDESEVTP